MKMAEQDVTPIVAIILFLIIFVCGCCRLCEYCYQLCHQGDDARYKSLPTDVETGLHATRLHENAYEIFRDRHVVTPEQMPRDNNGWDRLMHERGLLVRYRNTFILDTNYDHANVFTQPVHNGVYKSNRPLEIVDLNKNESTRKYEIAFKGPAVVYVRLDSRSRPGHFQRFLVQRQ